MTNSDQPVLDDFQIVTTGLDPVVHAEPSLRHGLPDQVRQ